MDYDYNELQLFVLGVIGTSQWTEEQIKFALQYHRDYEETQANAGLVVDAVGDLPENMRHIIPLELMKQVDEAQLRYLRSLGLVSFS